MKTKMPGVERRLAAILAADVVGYSRLMGRDEEGTLLRVKSMLANLFRPKTSQYNGRIVKTTGDGVLAEFGSVVDAFRCAVEIQDGIEALNGGIPSDNWLQLRIGINVGEIIIDDDDVFGDGVNVAARLEGLARPGGVCVSARAWEDLRKLRYNFEDLGDQQLKNIAQPVRAYNLSRPGRVGSRPSRFARLATRLRPVHALLLALLVVPAWLLVTQRGPSRERHDPKAFLTSVIDQAPCSWLRVAEHSTEGGEHVLSLARASLMPPDAIAAYARRAAATEQVKISKIETSQVAPLFDRQCAWIEKLKPLRYKGVPRVVVETKPPGKATATVHLTLDTRRLRKYYTAYGIEPNGAVAYLADSEELLAMAARPEGVTALPDGRLRLSIDMDHEGWSGIVFVETDNPLPEGLIERASQSVVDLQAFDKAARIGNVRVELAWFRSEFARGS
jgi:class 3 adenylate cyclase